MVDDNYEINLFQIFPVVFVKFLFLIKVVPNVRAFFENTERILPLRLVRPG